MTTHSANYPDTNVSLARRTSTDGRSTADTIEAAAPELKVLLGQILETGKTRVTEWKSRLQDGIGRNPIQSVLIAAAAGAVICLIVGRRS